MELTFQKTGLGCMQTLLNTQRQVEQTLELKLPEGLPDVGSVLGSWGQVLIRSKEWSGNSVGVSGGVMAWVLYMPEEGQIPLCVQGWLPFQSRWDIPQTDRDGSLCVSQSIRNVDARCISSRKLMVRAVVELGMKACVNTQYTVYEPGQIPEDVQLQREVYPMTLCTEMGEKTFQMDEILDLPANGKIPEKFICLRIQPELVDHKVIAGRLVFRGSLLIQGLCLGADGDLWPFDLDVPFSQYTELENEYEEEARAQVQMILTGLELDPENGGIHLKAGLTGQYALFDSKQVEVIGDAYSTRRPVEMTTESLELPGNLDRGHQRIQAQAALPEDCREVLDAVFLSQSVEQEPSPNGVTAQCAGRFQVLYYKNDGSLGCTWCRWEEQVPFTADETVEMSFSMIPSGKCQWAGGSLKKDLYLCWQSRGAKGIHMITGLKLEQEVRPDAQRPSLILRRCGDMTLWQMAKSTGSTVEAICKANGITEAPSGDAYLLIPVC